MKEIRHGINLLFLILLFVGTLIIRLKPGVCNSIFEKLSVGQKFPITLDYPNFKVYKYLSSHKISILPKQLFSRRNTSLPEIYNFTQGKPCMSSGIYFSPGNGK